HAAARPGADKAFLLEHGHRLADRRAADPEPLRQPPLVKPDLVRVVIDVHRANRPLQRGIRLLRETAAGVQPRHVEGGAGAWAGVRHASGIWYTTVPGNPLLPSG